MADPLAPFMHKLLTVVVPVGILCGIIGLALGLLKKGAESWLARFIRNLRQTPSTPAATSSNPPLCPECNRPMLLRESKTGPTAGTKFWGCPSFPSCRGTRSL